MRARRDKHRLVRRGEPERYDEGENLWELHALDRDHALARGATDGAIVVVIAGVARDEGNSMGVRGGMVTFPVLVMAVRVLATSVRHMLVRMVVHVAVQHVAGGAGRQIDDREQAG